MKILFLAPQPFFQERGTPIAVRLALEVLSQTGTEEIDLLTYHEGEDVAIPGVKLHRIRAPRWVRGITPGISLRKLICDLFFFAEALRMAWRARKDQYAVVHAVEEAVFIALAIKWMFGIPYVYDMDSSLALQVTEKWFLLRPLRPILNFGERLAVRQSLAVVPVCDALAVIARGHGSAETHVLHDISLLDRGARDIGDADLKEEAGIPGDHLVILYMGNLERYQGIDLLLQSFSIVARNQPKVSLAIIGGREAHIAHYTALSRSLAGGERVRFLGPRPVSALDQYLRQADILVSPRIKGNNTPMKIYSYLHSGKPIVATELPTHTQVMDRSVSMLAAPDPASFSQALAKVLDSPELRDTIGGAARRLAEERYTFEKFALQLARIYRMVGARISGGVRQEAT